MKNREPIHKFPTYLPIEIWRWVKRTAAFKEIKMNDVVIIALEELKKKYKKDVDNK